MNVTLNELRVLNVFLEGPTEQHYGLALMKATGLPSGTLYPILARYERRGWLRSANEDVDPQEARRPARRYYEITPDGLAGARAAKAEMMAALAPTKGRSRRAPRLQGDTA